MTADGDTYEMLWDCKFCRTPKLLGLSHRYCPVCGAPQDAAARYFPSDEEKVRVADHHYVGRDVACAHCGTFNSRNSQHCRDCGAPLAATKEAPQVLDESKHPEAALAAPKPKAQRRSLKAAIGVSLLLLVGFVLVFFLWKRDETFEVVSHEWERRVEIERFGPVRESAWCDGPPAGGREVRRYRAVRDHEKIPDGETCTTRRVDQGDGTFKEMNECEPRYRTREIEGDRCDYEVLRWKVARTAKSNGSALTPAPSWPDVGTLSNCTRAGCERPGERSETYRVLLRSASGDDTCDVPLATWQAMSPGARYSAKTRVMSSGVDCSSLRQQ